METMFVIRCKGVVDNVERQLVVDVSDSFNYPNEEQLVVEQARDRFTRQKTLELHERITRAIAESGFFLGEINTTGL